MKYDNFILIGQAPIRREYGAELMGRIATQLSTLFGCSLEEYARRTQRFNVLPCWPGRADRGDRFPKHLARQNASRMMYSFSDCHVLFIGLAVANIFDFHERPLQWRRLSTISGTYTAAVLPHPSGVNRWWNDAKNKQAAVRFMRKTWRKVY